MAAKQIRNMEEFASVSGISRPTVSKYFNDPTSVRPKTRERIEKALERYSYQPNIYAVNQNRQSTKNIGIVVPYLSDPFFAEIARTVEMLVIDAGYRPILLSSHGDPSLEIGNLESLRAIKPAGVLLAPLGRSSDVAALHDFCDSVQTVLFDSNIEGLGESFVGHNNFQATKMMIAYLIQSGEQPMFFEMRTPVNPNARKRRSAYTEAMEDLGLEPIFLQAEGEHWNFEEIGYRAGQQLLEKKNLATNTVFCSNDRLAIGFLLAAYEAGLRVGKTANCDLRVAGHDNHLYSRYTCPPLTTISHNYAAISAKAVETVLRLIESDSLPEGRQSALFDGELIPRASA